MKKLNMEAVKAYLLLHGEKIALGTCGVVAIIFLGFGLWMAISAGYPEDGSRPWAVEFKEVTDKLARDVQSVPSPKLEEETAKKLKPEQYDWEYRASNYVGVGLIQINDRRDDTKRYRPNALTPKRDEKSMSFEYIRAGILVHNEFDPDTKKLAGYESPEAPGGFVPPVLPPPGKKGPETPVTLPPYAHGVRPTRMVVANLVFPLKEQVAEFQKALRHESQKELFDNPDDLPRFLGFTVMRFEVLPNGTWANPDGVVIIGKDPKTGQMKVAPNLRKMLRDAVFDDHTPQLLEPYIYAGLTMPLPKLANAKYTKPNLDGVEIAWEDEDPKGKDPLAMKGKFPPPKDKGPGIIIPGGKKPKDFVKPPDPMGPKEPGVAGPERKVIPIEFKNLKKGDPALANRMYNKEFLDKDFNPYHVLGLTASKGPAEKDNKFNPKPFPGGGVGPGMPPMGDDTRYFDAWQIKDDETPGEVEPPKLGKPGEQPGPGAPVFANWKRDAILRFADLDVEPGKVYQYAVQVRIANPNFKHPNVAFAALAKDPELPLNPKDSWVLTRAITIPEDYFLYSVDQAMHDEWLDPNPPKNPAVKAAKDQTPIQVHQWLQTRKDNSRTRDEYTFADFAVAERLLLRRGEEIGINVYVQVPAWKIEKDAFEMPSIKDTKKGAKEKTKPGLDIDLRPMEREKDGVERPTLAPVLVDFAGGKDAAVEALIMLPDGTLVIRNSRIDSDVTNPWARERAERVISTRKRNDESNGKSAGPVMPKAPDPGGGS
jgi:hypothetical protein